MAAMCAVRPLGEGAAQTADEGALNPALSQRERGPELDGGDVCRSPAGRRCRATADEGALTPALSQREREAKRGRVSLTMIVRDEERNLPHSLTLRASIAG